MSRIAEEFFSTCKANCHKDAVIYASHNQLVHKTYQDVLLESNAMTRYMLSLGVKKGDRILAFAPPNYELCIFMLASFRLGASIMYVDIWAKQDRLKHAFEQYQPDYIVISKKTEKIKFLFREINKIKKIIYVDRIDHISTDEIQLDYEVEEDTVGLLTLTTGSTGKPKAAIRTHANLYEQLSLVKNNLVSRVENEYVLTTSYIYIFSNLLSGFTTVLPQLRLGKINPAKLDQKLRIYQELPITMLFTTPDFCLMATNIFPKLHNVSLGGAILNINEARIIYEKFKQANIYYIYGATECNLISSIMLEDYIDHLLREGISILGTPAKGVRIKTNGQDQIMVTSHALLEDYLVVSKANKQKDDQEVLWHNTGDAGCFENNQLVYYGRQDTRLPFGNHLYSSQIEQLVTAKFSFIYKCGLLCDQNKKIVLFVECKKKMKMDKEAIESYLKENYPASKVVVKKLRKIPCDVKHHTKVNYNKLRKMM